MHGARFLVFLYSGLTSVNQRFVSCAVHVNKNYSRLVLLTQQHRCYSDVKHRTKLPTNWARRKLDRYKLSFMQKMDDPQMQKLLEPFRLAVKEQYKNEAKLTSELLDTELNQSEGPTGSPRWTGYMDHVLLGEGTPNFFKSPVYLQRNAGCRRNKTRNGPIDKTDVDSDSCKIDLSGLEDSAAGDAVKGLVGLNPGKAVCRSDYGKSSEEVPCLTCKFDINKCKILFVANNDSTNSDILLYKSSALGRARESHPEDSEKLNRKFHCWHNKWLKDNVLEEESKKCQSWLLGHTEDSVPTKCIKVDDPLKPPYAVFNRYKTHEVA